jgi:hypothetical protein
MSDPQPDPSVVVLYASDGAAHFTSPASQFARDGLASGDLTTEQPDAEEVAGAPETSAAGDDQHPRARKRRGPVDGKPEADGADGSH